MAGIDQITGIAMVVGDLEAACGFYATLGFIVVERRAGVAVLGLGEQRIELVASTPASAPYPAERSAANPWFQHFAIVVSDMAAAYAHLQAAGGWLPISTDGPQVLPPETGGVVAFKLRDPDGHPLELSWLPPAIAGKWAQAKAPGPFLGIDHSALGVADTTTSVAFYEGHGLQVAASQTNSGPAQDRLDGLTSAIVEITTLKTAGEGPHIELLNYRLPRRPRLNVAVTDIAATRLILRGAGDGITQDPDGHWLEWRS